MINSFRHDYYFLSNFYDVPVMYNGITYENNEAAFQAQKTLDNNKRKEFEELSPSDAKHLGRHVKLRSDWEQIKEKIMYEIVYTKFTQNSDLKSKLLRTKDEILEEGNTWGDREWGTVNGVGKNKLGEILMRVRDDLR